MITPNMTNNKLITQKSSYRMPTGILKTLFLAALLQCVAGSEEDDVPQPLQDAMQRHYDETRTVMEPRQLRDESTNLVGNRISMTNAMTYTRIFRKNPRQTITAGNTTNIPQGRYPVPYQLQNARMEFEALNKRNINQDELVELSRNLDMETISSFVAARYLANFAEDRGNVGAGHYTRDLTGTPLRCRCSGRGWLCTKPKTKGNFGGRCKPCDNKECKPGSFCTQMIGKTHCAKWHRACTGPVSGGTCTQTSRRRLVTGDVALNQRMRLQNEERRTQLEQEAQRLLEKYEMQQWGYGHPIRQNPELDNALDEACEDMPQNVREDFKTHVREHVTTGMTLEDACDAVRSDWDNTRW